MKTALKPAKDARSLLPGCGVTVMPAACCGKYRPPDFQPPDRSTMQPQNYKFRQVRTTNITKYPPLHLDQGSIYHCSANLNVPSHGNFGWTDTRNLPFLFTTLPSVLLTPGVIFFLQYSPQPWGRCRSKRRQPIKVSDRCCRARPWRTAGGGTDNMLPAIRWSAFFFLLLLTINKAQKWLLLTLHKSTINSFCKCVTITRVTDASWSMFAFTDMNYTVLSYVHLGYEGRWLTPLRISACLRIIPLSSKENQKTF